MKNIIEKLEQIIERDLKLSFWEKNVVSETEIEYRCDDDNYFTWGPNDDDFPEFTGERKIFKELLKHFDAKNIELYDSEKGWFNVSIKRKGTKL